LLEQIAPSPGLFHSDLISIRSTNYNRTIQSVAGFLSTLLPGVRSIPIAYYPNRLDEVMLGSVKHLVAAHAHEIDETADEEPKTLWAQMTSKAAKAKPQQPRCPRAASLLEQMHTKGYSTTNATTLREFRKIFGEDYIQKVLSSAWHSPHN
jgi:hypothetical protein